MVDGINNMLTINNLHLTLDVNSVLNGLSLEASRAQIPAYAGMSGGRVN